jgi:enamine deaminase RidA (YjgF/YER057c/UK114 family)
MILRTGPSVRAYRVSWDGHPCVANLAPAQQARIAAYVCGYYGVTLADVLARGRAAPVVECRQMIGALLAAAGDTVANAARFLDRDHSTVLYGIHKVHTRPRFADAWGALAPWVVPCAVSLEAGIAAAVATLTPSDRRCITAYLTVCVRGLPGRAPEGIVAYHALALLGAHPEITDQIAACLEAHDERAAAVLLRDRLRRLAA